MILDESDIPANIASAADIVAEVVKKLTDNRAILQK